MRNIVNAPVGMAGYYRLVTRKASTGRVSCDTGWFKNVITNAGLEYIGSTSPSDARTDRVVSVGTGTAAAATTDTALQSWVASTTNKFASPVGNTSSSPYYSQYTPAYRFAAGAAAGNISEVGIGWTSGSGGSLFSRSLILNESAAPTTITVLSDEFLDVYYSFRVYPPTTDVTGTILISGDSYDYTLRAANVTSVLAWNASRALDASWNSASAGVWSGAINAAITGGPAGTGGAPDTFNDGGTLAAYSATSKQRDVSLSWSLTRGNMDIRSVLFSTYGRQWQVEFDPIIPKTGVKQLSLTIRNAWDRRP